MKYFVLILLSLNLFSEFQAEYWTYGKRRIEKIISGGKNETKDSRKTEQTFLVSGKFTDKKENFFYDFQFHFIKKLKESESKDLLYLGENAHIGFGRDKYSFSLGRNKFHNYFPEQKMDGVEGISARFSPNENFKLEFYFLDFYRAYPILERVFFLDKKQNLNSENLRHGLSFEFQNKNFYSRFSFLYINLRNSSKIANDESRTKPNGDNDFLYNTSWNLFWKNSYFISGFNFTVSRGLDKTLTNPEREERRSIPITGELVEFFFKSSLSYFKFQTSFFLPDTDKRNSSGEILEYGSVGFGSPVSGIFMAQSFNFYPTAWITDIGFEKNFTIQDGRWNSFWGSAKLGFEYQNFQVNLIFNHFTPRNLKESNGSISVQKRDYERFFLMESSLEFIYGKKDLGYYVKSNFSYFYSNKEISIEGNSFFISGGIWL